MEGGLSFKYREAHDFRAYEDLHGKATWFVQRFFFFLTSNPILICIFLESSLMNLSEGTDYGTVKTNSVHTVSPMSATALLGECEGETIWEDVDYIDYIPVVGKRSLCRINEPFEFSHNVFVRDDFRYMLSQVSIIFARILIYF